VLGVAQGADQRDEIQAELVLGQSESPLGLGSQGPSEAGAIPVATASDLDGHADGPVAGDDGAAVGVGGPEGQSTFGAVGGQAGQIELAVGYGAGGPSGHRCISTSKRCPVS
jgi:hypothetical protein